jgi:signal transduction histidine kinase
VLQTLALIQRSAHDPTRMTSLARRQERELRAWLYGGREPGTERGLRAELERIAVEVEQLHGVPVEVVVVGDGDTDDRLEEMLAAAREAMVNAAKHSGATRVDVFAEVRPEQVVLFVRDTGKGFDPATVPADRAGLRSSIRARMARIGGEAVIESAPGEGAEVELRLARSAP